MACPTLNDPVLVQSLLVLQHEDTRTAKGYHSWLRSQIFFSLSWTFSGTIWHDVDARSVFEQNWKWAALCRGDDISLSDMSWLHRVLLVDISSRHATTGSPLVSTIYMSPWIKLIDLFTWSIAVLLKLWRLVLCLQAFPVFALPDCLQGVCPWRDFNKV